MNDVNFKGKVIWCLMMIPLIPHIFIYVIYKVFEFLYDLSVKSNLYQLYYSLVLKVMKKFRK